MALQAAYFVLLARLLGVFEYGVFAGTFAIVNTLTPYSALGASMLFMRHLAVDTELAGAYWGNSLLTTTGFTILSILGTLLLAFGIHVISRPGMLLVLLVANCLFLQITTLGGMMMFTLGNARISAILNLLGHFSRVIVLVVMKLTMGHANAFQWSIGILIGSAAAAGVVLYVVRQAIGKTRYDVGLLRRRSAEGLGFAFAGTTDAVYNDLDKIMLSHYGMNLQNGFYTLAYRIVDFATSPIFALTMAVMQKHFVLTRSRIRLMIRLTIKSLTVSVLLGLAVAAGTWIASPLVPAIAGRDFSGAVAVLKLLCWLPLIRAVHQACGSTVTGLGHQNWRTGAQSLVAVFNVALNVLWIPSFGWRGAVWSTLASDGLLAVLNTLLLLMFVRGLLRAEQPSAEQVAGS